MFILKPLNRLFNNLFLTLLSIILIVALFFLAACGGEPTREAVGVGEVYTYWFPAVWEGYSYDGGKAGIGVITNNRADWARPRHNDTAQIGADWWYNWGQDADLRGSAQAHGEYVPMVWGGRQREIEALRGVWCPAYSGPVLWLNEPELHSQARMTPDQAVDSLEMLRLECPNAQIIGPQTGPFDPDFVWLREFWSLWQQAHGGPPPVTAVGLHIYNHPAPGDWIEAFYLALPEYTGPVWITEFAVCRPGVSAAEAMRRYVAAFEADARVARYAPFANRVDGSVPDFSWLACASMFDEQSQLTAVGRAYRDAAARLTTEAYP